MYGALYLWWYFAVRSPHNVSLARTRSSARESRDRQRVCNTSRLFDLRARLRVAPATRADFGATIAQLTARLDEQASQIQKVSASSK